MESVKDYQGKKKKKDYQGKVEILFVSFKMGALGIFTLKGYERNLDERLERGQTLK